MYLVGFDCIITFAGLIKAEPAAALATMNTKIKSFDYFVGEGYERMYTMLLNLDELPESLHRGAKVVCSVAHNEVTIVKYESTEECALAAVQMLEHMNWALQEVQRVETRQYAMVFFDTTHLCKLAHIMPILSDYKAILESAYYLPTAKKSLAVVLVDGPRLPVPWRRIVAGYFPIVDGVVLEAGKFSRWFALNSITQAQVMSAITEALPNMKKYTGSMAAQ